MNSGFVLALGLAAIDGLTSAFVAMLILALAVIGSGQSGTPQTSQETALLSIQKSSLKFSIAVEPVCGSDRSTRVPRGSLINERLREIESHTQNGSIIWIDSCSASDEKCQAQLIINKPKKKERWRIYIANANTQGNFTERSKGPVNIEVTLANSLGSVKVPDAWPIDDNWHAYDFSPTETPEIRKVVDPTKC